MKKLTILTALLLTTTLTAAEIDKAPAAVSGKEATFVQRFTPKGFKNAQVESGTVLFGNLPQMRWSYAKPEQKLFVFDGDRSWFYVPADKQVTVATLDAQKRRDLPFLVLGDASSRDRSFVVKEKASGGNVITTLQPRDSSGLLRSIAITSSASTHLIQSVEYTDREGNRTVFELSGYHPASASSDAFRFTPPAGVQTVHAD
ncbi:MAG TPA: outer membrane lipoprotein chaperone LolA [Thermoanaerobaculia bacterium]|nr:outer membrane lipoprotein chaperone LolA [Thermoanaerobaculia bacterium]